MGDPNHDCRIAAGGRCCTIEEVWTSQMQIVKCLECERVCRNMWAYNMHYQAVHRVPDDLLALD